MSKFYIGRAYRTVKSSNANCKNRWNSINFNVLKPWKWYHCELRYKTFSNYASGLDRLVELVLTGFGRRTDGIIAQYIRYNSLTVIPPITGTMNSLHIWWVIDCSVFSQSSWSRHFWYPYGKGLTVRSSSYDRFPIQTLNQPKLVTKIFDINHPSPTVE